jgi:hypothetical protein
MSIENNFFVVILVDDRHVKWAKVIGRRKAVDDVFDWLVKTLGQDDCKWISILSHDGDAIVLDVHFFDLNMYDKFYKKYEQRYLPKE